MLLAPVALAQVEREPEPLVPEDLVLPVELDLAHHVQADLEHHRPVPRVVQDQLVELAVEREPQELLVRVVLRTRLANQSGQSAKSLSRDLLPAWVER